MKIYIAVNKKGKILPGFSPQTDPGDVFREMSEYGSDLSKFDVAMFDLKKMKPSKILPGTKSDYYHEVDDELSSMNEEPNSNFN